ncbi:GNAT family N-acetyltransferase [Camelliibacillus cellulosilyticus]|uniref:GNAT family N-acetyltransferase n=1 Tax=Camelliibacillus cellulosilyticus TaxID=2174486 RepID=UPI00366AD196
MKEVTSKTIHPSIRKLLSYATSESKVIEEYDNYIRSLNRKLYSFELESEIVGVIGIEMIRPNNGVIKHIAVSPNQRGHEIGSRMIKFVCEIHSLSYISAETDRDAVGFYRKYGFQITSLGEKYPGVERFECEYAVK